MVCLCGFKILLTVFNQSYNCQTSHYLSRNRLPKPFLILPSQGKTLLWSCTGPVLAMYWPCTGLQCVVYKKDFCFPLRFGEDLFYEIPHTLDGIVVVAVVSLLQNKTWARVLYTTQGRKLNTVFCVFFYYWVGTPPVHTDAFCNNLRNLRTDLEVLEIKGVSFHMR